MVTGDTPTTPATSTRTALPPTVRRRINPPELQEAGNQMKEDFHMLNSVISKREHKEENECDLFGKMLAKKLRNLPHQEQILYVSY